MEKDALSAAMRAADDVEGLLASIRELMEEEREAALRDPRNWGYAGDFGHLREKLTELRAFLAGEA